jgi:carboxypeptidase D
MSARIMRLVTTFLVIFAVTSTVSAGKLRDVGQNKGYHPKLAERLRRRGTEDAKPKPQPVVERAAATTAAPTSTSP